MENVKNTTLDGKDVSTSMEEQPKNQREVSVGSDQITKPLVDSPNQTINSRTNDSSINISSAPKKKLSTFSSNINSPVINLNNDVPDSEKIVDHSNESTGQKTVETIVIDLSDDEDVIPLNTENDNDDILVIDVVSSRKPELNSEGRELKTQLAQKRCHNNTNTTDTCCKITQKKKVCFCQKAVGKSKMGTSLPESETCNIGENVYVNSPIQLPKKGLRPIIIDGSNVAFGSQNNFSVKRIEICIKYFKEKGHKVTTFVPQYRLKCGQNDNKKLLTELVKSGDVILTPSKVIDGKIIVSYDDRFIVQTAVLQGGVIVSRNNYLDLLNENPTWADTIKYRTLPFTWIDDLLMFPQDPLGKNGPTLKQFLRFDQVNN